MLALLQVVSALSLSSLLLQAGASPVSLPDHDLKERTSPGRTGAVASESDICSDLGIDLLAKGGNAADAVSSSRSLVT